MSYEVYLDGRKITLKPRDKEDRLTVLFRYVYSFWCVTADIMKPK